MSELDKVSEFLTKRQKIDRDPNLSQDGRRAAHEALNLEIGAHKPVAINNLRTSIELAKSHFKNAEQAINKAISDEAANWDYGRLNYAARAVSAQFENMTSPEEAAMLYDQLQGSHDHYSTRAAAEIGQGIVLQRFGRERTLELTTIYPASF